jgi:hypothetical protein
MAGLLAVFVGFERELLGERVRAGRAHTRQNGMPARSGSYTAPAIASLRSPDVFKYACSPKNHFLWILGREGLHFAIEELLCHSFK